jgi:FtsP/CotA-like multicopper oxidase with cupredoxin domain
VVAAAALLIAGMSSGAFAAKRVFEMNIEDTKIVLVEKQQFHTFAFAGQVPGPLFYVDEGDQIEVTVNNLTALPHTIHWHGMFQRDTWQMDGVPDVTQPGIAPATASFIPTAEPSGTFWYHRHVNERARGRGTTIFIVYPKKPVAIEKKVTREFAHARIGPPGGWTSWLRRRTGRRVRLPRSTAGLSRVEPHPEGRRRPPAPIGAGG